ncbi:MAG TPA: patatin-like phospholipase family protein [Tepidisphaeraceae bacterium]|nr:patatin-like phospholipase family protein [Tepidisphaeraceae bacterium]
MPYRILTFDGGGILGIYSARLLHHLVNAYPNLLPNTDLLAGTSTGGIICLGLANGMSPDALVSLYQANGNAIFDRSWLHDIGDLGGLSGAHYDNRNLESIVCKTFGQTKLGDLQKKVLVPSFDLDNSQDPWSNPAAPGFVRTWKPKFFHNFPGPDSDGEQLAADVAMRTSAAPTYFPTYQHYIDGGVVANNPSMSALAQALDPGTGNQRLADISLLSIGTGINSQYVAGHNLDWGVAHWASTLASLMISGVAGVADYQCARLLGPRYLRVDPVLPAPWKMDDVGDVAAMIAAADKAMDAASVGAIVEWMTANY